MMFTGATIRSGALPFLLPLLLLSPSDTFANSFIAGGWVPVMRNLVVIANPGADPAPTSGPVEIATIQIDNNLPDYEIVFDFSGPTPSGRNPSDGNGDADPVSEVSLQGMDGMLGKGLTVPNGEALGAGPGPGQYTWRPGRQETATVGYRVRVMATFKRPLAEPPLLAVGMPFSF